MGRPPATSDDAIEKAAKAIRQAATVEDLRAAQAALLPLIGLTLDQTAQIVGKNRHWVSRARMAFLQGQPAPATHGGRRRETVEVDEEVELLREALKQCGAKPTAMLSVRTLTRQALAKRGHEDIGESTVTAIVHRAFGKLVPGMPVSHLQGYSAAIGRMLAVQEQIQAVIDRYRT